MKNANLHELQTVNKFVTFNRYIQCFWVAKTTLLVWSQKSSLLRKISKHTEINGLCSVTGIFKCLFLPPYITTNFGLYPAVGPVRGLILFLIAVICGGVRHPMMMKPHPERTFRLTDFISIPSNVEIIETGHSEVIWVR